MVRQVFVLLLFSSLLPHQTPNCGCEAYPQINVLAVVNGIKITKQDLSIDTRTQVSIAQDTVVTARNLEVSLQINKLLLQAEAKRRGLTPEKLVEVEVKDKIPPPTNEQVKTFYEQNKRRIAKDFKSVKADIVARMRNDREMIRAAEFANALRDAAQITFSDQPVTPPANEADLDRVFAIVNGVNITSRDVEQSLLPLIFRVQQQVYALHKQDLNLKINEMLLDQEAKRLGLSPQWLINQNVKVRLPIITEGQARAYYDEHKTRLAAAFSDLKVLIMQYLLQQEELKLFQAYADQLRKGAAVQIYLTEPKSPTLRQLCCNPVD